VEGAHDAETKEGPSGEVLWDVKEGLSGEINLFAEGEVSKEGVATPESTACHEGGMEWSSTLRKVPGRRSEGIASKCSTKVT
jgi:hypothetical protein